METIRSAFMVQFRAPLTPWVWLVASILTAVAGPFGTYDAMSFGVRIGFWTGLIAISILTSYAICALATSLLPKMHAYVHDAVVTVIFCFLFTPVVMVALIFATPPEHPIGITMWNLGLEVFLITGTIVISQRLVKTKWPNLAPSNEAPEPEALEPRLMRRLDDVVAADVLRMTVKDHYVVVILHGRPEQRILMRFGDAVDEIEGLEGFCVHRSHWVVRAAINGMVTENGREMVELIDGSRVPVSRTYRPNLVEAGVIVSEKVREVG